MLQVITAPTTTSISLADAKRQVQVTTTDHNTILTDITKAADAYIERAIPGGRAVATQTLEEHRLEFPECGAPIELPRPPLASSTQVTHVKYWVSDGDTAITTLSTSKYSVVAYASQPGKIYLDPKVNTEWPSVAATDRPDKIQIRWVAGYSTPPANIKHAARLLVGHWFENREGVITGTVSKEIELAVASLIGKSGYGHYG